MESLSKKLKSIYKAAQCADENDLDIAIEQSRALIKTHGYEPQLVKRIVSLENKRKKINK